MKLVKLEQVQEFSKVIGIKDWECTIAMSCTPAWYPEQHKLTE